MRGISKVSMIFVDIAAVLLVAGLVFLILPKIQKPSVVNTPHVTTTTPMSIISNTNDYSISVFYPELNGLPEFNALSKKIAQTEVATFNTASLNPALGIPGMKFYFNGSFDIPVMTNRLVSAEYDFETFSGGGHPINYQLSVVYDVQNKKRIALADLFQPQMPYLESISKLVRTELEKTLTDDTIFDDGLLPVQENFSQFLLTKNGLTFLFSPYQIASYAEGAQRVTIPFEKLDGILSAYGLEIISAVRE